MPFLWIGGWCLLILWGEPRGYALFLLATVALHETGHIFGFLVTGEPLPGFSGRHLGLLLTPQGKLLSYKKELLICGAGPAFNLLAAAALVPALRGGTAHEASFCFFALNLLTAGLNLAPIDGFDGGRMLSALLSVTLGPQRGGAVAAAISLIFALLFYFTALFFVFFCGFGLQFLFLSLLLLLAEVRRRPWLFEDFGAFRRKRQDFLFFRPLMRDNRKKPL